MSVFFDKRRKRWRYEFKLKGVRHTSPYFDTRREAREAEAEKRRELKNPGPKEIIATDMVFSDLVNKRLDYLEAYDTPRHYKDVLYYARRWVHRLEDDQQWGEMLCSEITDEMILRFILNRNKETSPQTANKDLRLLRSVFKYGVDKHWIEENPAKEVDFLPVKNRKKDIPSKEDLLKLILAADPDTQDYLWTIALTLGRVGEINRLVWDDVDFEQRIVWLHTRKKKHGDEEPRPVPMHDKLLDVLGRRYERRNPEKPWVFWHRYSNSKTGEWTEGPYTYRRIMGSLCKKAGIDKPFGFHALRHLGASMMAEEGHPLPVIQRLLGHENIETTRIYLHSLGVANREAIKTFDKLDVPQGEGSDQGGQVSMPKSFWSRKVERPPFDVLMRDVEELGYRGSGRKYGVSDTTIRRWLAFYEAHKGKLSRREAGETADESDEKVLANVLAMKKRTQT